VVDGGLTGLNQLDLHGTSGLRHLHCLHLL
jgi:hypothetical protein